MLKAEPRIAADDVTTDLGHRYSSFARQPPRIDVRRGRNFWFDRPP